MGRANAGRSSKISSCDVIKARRSHEFCSNARDPNTLRSRCNRRRPEDQGQGSSVALSADGNTAILGGSAAWVFTRSGGVWTQHGSKLVGAGAVGQISQGSAVALSADGNTAILGGPGDNNIGAAWVFVRD
jgi:hypothetical protein